MTNHPRGAWTAVGCLLALMLGSAPARSQTSFTEDNGVYTIVDDNTRAESLMRLEFIPDERDGFMVATIFGSTSGSTGRYRVFAGPIFAQGPIPVATAYLFAAKAPCDPIVMITAGFRGSSSPMTRSSSSARVPMYRRSNMKFCPSTYPSSRSPLSNAAKLAWFCARGRVSRMPMA